MGFGTPAFNAASPPAIGSTTPAAITGTTLTATVKVVVPDGSIAVPSIQGATDGTGFSFTAAGFKFSYAGFEIYAFTNNDILLSQAGGYVRAGDSGGHGFTGRLGTFNDSGSAWELRYNSTLTLSGTATKVTVASGVGFQLGVAAAAAVAVASTHKLAVTDNTGTTYYLLATTVP